ncbi:MAG TPA: exonuclease domain-containing protein [Desulfohalobiaceae bacterium]|nr:exonuclease domain-containing protein [Desulfohalobiaceae bacterium]
MDLKHKYWFIALACLFSFIAIISGLAFYIWITASITYQKFLISFIHDYLALFLLAGLAFFVIVLFILNEVFQSFILPLYNLIEGTELISAINPSHRINIEGVKELVTLADRINKTAECLENMQRKLQKYTKHVSARLEEEKNRLIKVISCLPVGVVVCNSCGEIILYNRRAKALLSNCINKERQKSKTKSQIGIGRSIIDLCDHNLFSHIKEKLNAGVQSPSRCKEHRFQTTGSDGVKIQVYLAPLFLPKDKFAGLTCLFDLQTDEQTNLLQDYSSILYDQQHPSYSPMNEVFPEEEDGCFYDFFLTDVNFWQIKGIEDKPLKELSYTVFDLETTGLRPDSGDEIISVSAVRVVNNKIIFEESYNQLINPQRPIPEESIRIHGIRPEILQGQPLVEEVLPDFQQFIKETVLVGHNIDFDLRFLHLKEKKLGLSFDHPSLDILFLSCLVQPNQEDHSLEGIAQRLGTNVYARHTSFGDALTAAEILLSLLPLLEGKGIYTLSQAKIASQHNKLSRFIL